MSFDSAGGLLGMLDPLKRVYDYLKGVKETRDVRRQLENVLQSLKLFASSAKASEKAGKALTAKVDALDPPISVDDVEDLMKLSTEFFTIFRVFVSSICSFGKECNDLLSGDFDAFMERVKARKPDVYDILRFFGRNYDTTTKSLDLTRLPVLMRLYGSKGSWRESKDLSKVVAEGREKVDKLMEKGKVIKMQRFTIKNRAMVVGYLHSFQRLAREMKRLRSSKETTKDLKRTAPSWYLGLSGIADDLRKALPSG